MWEIRKKEGSGDEVGPATMHIARASNSYLSNRGRAIQYRQKERRALTVGNNQECTNQSRGGNCLVHMIYFLSLVLDS